MDNKTMAMLAQAVDLIDGQAQASTGSAKQALEAAVQMLLAAIASSSDFFT